MATPTEYPLPTEGAEGEWNEDSIRQEVNALRHKPGALLPILHAIQDRIGYIPEGAVAVIAEALQQTRAEIHGVISFYHHFRTRPAGTHVLQICRAEACQSMGCRALESHIQQRLGIGFHQTTHDREFTLEPVYCLGNCACAPSIRLDDRILGRMTPEKFDLLAEQLTTSTLEVQ
ncbi:MULTISPECIES: formate dehydrogenase subunit gamma [Marinobacter]|uniref:NADH-quinone oxidoreductase subunit E n=1 Tax=Marinobacter suaedae TaxID=3057675 RepID=A0ABT8VZS4_9GAMM|nr:MULTISPECIES: formate dehydrogenase subunit gamma [unclassified Marinobacter]MBZ2169656.1 formate dehydrogenase subunit gamma [Marinobacter sp. F4216]MDO3721489.1 formate dehydrogenase subunit gamma [Marinobacter sp. chi1]